MTVTAFDKDYESLSFTLTADFAASTDDVWQLWADPRQLERWWGPPTFPATMTAHDLTPGGSVNYYMTSPEGEKFHGWWKITSVTPKTGIELIDGFADENGEPNDAMPVTTMRLQLSDHEGGTRMELRSSFGSREQMDQLVEMGMQEGMSLAVGQMDGLLEQSSVSR